MRLLTEEEIRNFSLEREIARSDDEGVLEDNKVVSDDDVEPALPSVKVDMSEDYV